MSIPVRLAGFALALSAVVGIVGKSIAEDLPPPSSQAGHLITQPGRTELLRGQVILDVQKSKAGELTVRVTRKLPDVPPLTNLESDFSVRWKTPKDPATWFVYTDDGERFWLYDGRDAGLLRVFIEQGPPKDNIAVTTCQKTYQAADAVLLKTAPKAVRDRLPKELLGGGEGAKRGRSYCQY